MKLASKISSTKPEGRIPAGRMTSAGYAELPEGPPYHELIDGELRACESPTVFHQRISAKLYRALSTWTDRTSAGEVLYAPLSVCLSPFDVLLPDLLFIARNRLLTLEGDRVQGPPDLVIEILSPSTAPLDRNRKRGIYGRAGVRELWIVDPESCRIEVHRLSAGADRSPRSFAVGTVLTTPSFPGLEIEIGRIFENRPA